MHSNFPKDLHCDLHWDSDLNLVSILSWISRNSLKFPICDMNETLIGISIEISRFMSLAILQFVWMEILIGIWMAILLEISFAILIEISFAILLEISLRFAKRSPLRFLSYSRNFSQFDRSIFSQVFSMRSQWEVHMGKQLQKLYKCYISVILSCTAQCATIGVLLVGRLRKLACSSLLLLLLLLHF